MIINETPSQLDPPGPRMRVLVLSTIAFTILFAVWLMLGVLGVPIKNDAALMLGEAAQSMSKEEISIASEQRFEWLLAVAILSGSLLRLNFGIWADRFGGRNTMIFLLLISAVPTLCLAYATNFTALLICAALFGLAGNSFSVGISWNSAWFPAARKGTALGIFGAGNVGASGTKLLIVLVPTILTMVPATGYLAGWIPGGWRIVPVGYSVLLVVTALAIFLWCPNPDRTPGQGRPMREMLAPLSGIRVWRFSLYYVVVFGAYVALAAWLPNYYVKTYALSLRDAALLTSLFIFPASLLRPLGGWLSDRYGPRAVTVSCFIGMSLALIPLCIPASVVSLGVTLFTVMLVLVGVGMGIGKASVYKYIPNFYPKDVGAVGGLVGLFGALGGFILPKLFGWLGRETGVPQAAFLVLLVLTLASLGWLTAVLIHQARRKPKVETIVIPDQRGVVKSHQTADSPISA